MIERRNVYEDIMRERARQDAQWGGAALDDTHSMDTWALLIAKHAGLLAAATIGQDQGSPVSPMFRERLVKVAALCVAGMEATDRRH